jgi:hypothetical protein
MTLAHINHDAQPHGVIECANGDDVRHGIVPEQTGLA